MKFSNRLKNRRKILGLTQKNIAEGIGVSKVAVSRWELGYSIPDGVVLNKLGELLDYDVEYLLSGNEDKCKDVTMVDFYNSVSASAGNGYMNDSECYMKIPIPKNIVDNQVNKESVCCIKVSGNSMEPVLGHNSVIALNPNKKLIQDGMMYVIRQKELLRVKILVETPNEVIIKSYNSNFPDEIYNKDSLDDFDIIGQVFWYSSALNI
ncbi:helix-turn-helix domain-containing protein [Aliivibrio sifiae]